LLPFLNLVSAVVQKRKKEEKKKSGAIISFCFSIINCLDIKDTVLDLDFEGFNGKQHL